MSSVKGVNGEVQLRSSVGSVDSFEDVVVNESLHDDFVFIDFNGLTLEHSPELPISPLPAPLPYAVPVLSSPRAQSPSLSEERSSAPIAPAQISVEKPINVQVLPLLALSETMSRGWAQFPVWQPLVTEQPLSWKPVPGLSVASGADVDVPLNTELKNFSQKAKGGFLRAIRWGGELVRDIFDEPFRDISPRSSTSSSEELD